MNSSSTLKSVLYQRAASVSEGAAAVREKLIKGKVCPKMKIRGKASSNSSIQRRGNSWCFTEERNA